MFAVQRRAVLAGMGSLALAPGLARADDAAPPSAPVEPAEAVAPPAAVAPAMPAPAAAPELATWQRRAVTAPAADGRPIISVVIDDMGVMHPHTENIVALPHLLTLSWFPFARHLPEQVSDARGRGHETMLHMPMQSFGHDSYSVGPNPLRVDLPPDENLHRLRDAIAAVPEIVGLNNHMGCVATRDATLMDLVAGVTHENGLLFLDSLTIGHSQGYARNHAAGVPAASRDTFIDDKKDEASLLAAFALTEATARKHGNAVAIGHPRPWTIAALSAWLPTLQDKGFVLWPLSATVALRNGIAMPTAAV